MKRILTITFLLLNINMLAQSEAEISLQPDSLSPLDDGYLLSSEKDYCAWPPPGFNVIHCRSAFVYSLGSNPIPIEVFPGQEQAKKKIKRKKMKLDTHPRGIIDSKKEFRKLSVQLELDVNWKTEKVTFYTTSRTYKHGQLNSDYTLMGASLSEDSKTLSLGYQSTFHGVCQGIAQQAEWYSSESSIFALVIPASVEEITSMTCHRGPDCSNIP